MSDEIREDVESIVMTQEQHKKSKKGRGVKTPIPEKEKVVEEKKKIVDEIYEAGFALPGESTVAFVHKWIDGKEYKYNLVLDNKRYAISNELKEDEKDRIRTALKANGFVDVTVIESGAVYDKNKKEYIYRVIHPEQNPKNSINGVIALVLYGDDGKPVYYKDGVNAGKQKQVQVNITDGIVQTDDKMIYEALLKAGFVTTKTIEKTQGGKL